MKSNRWQHLLFWLCYWIFEVYVEYAWLSSPGATTPRVQLIRMAVTGEVIQLAVKVGLSYFIAYLVNGNPSRLKPAATKIIAAALAFAAAVIIQRFLIIRWILPDIYGEPVNDRMLFAFQRIVSTLVDIAFIVGVFVAIKQYRGLQRAREAGKVLMKEKLVSELKFLRTQTNPHFLFNTLNNIYALARKKSDQTADVVMKLSKLLRFMLYESGKDRITIAEEIRFLQDYIELEQIRYNERLSISFTREIDNESEPIAPLILLPLVENAFKHGAGETRFKSYIDIRIKLTKGQLDFQIANSKDEDWQESVAEHIGLSNVRRQLELMYPSHKLVLENKPNDFIVHLSINLDEYAAI
jgi:two-component system LytT family sensor kinase